MLETLFILAGLVLAFAFGRITKSVPRLMTESEVVEGLRAMFVKDIADLDGRLVSRDCGWSEGDSLRSARAMTQRMLNKLPPTERTTNDRD